MPQVQEYIDAQGRSSFGKWFEGLATPAALKVRTALGRLEDGNTGALKAVGQGVHEVLIDFGPGYRVYLGWDGLELVILLGGSSKARQSLAIADAQGRGKSTGCASAVASEEGKTMPLTKDFRDTVKARADRDPAFRAGLYQEAAQAILEGDFGTGRILLRDFINATIGFAELARALDVSDKSVMRMLGANGNPTAGNLLRLLRTLQDECRITVTVEAKTVRRRRTTLGLLAA